MRSRQRILAEFEHLAGIWLDALDGYSEEEFRRPSAGGGWSLGQVYDHIVDAGLRFAVPKLEKCLDPDRPPTTSGRTFLGRIFFLYGGFPPVRIRLTLTKGYSPGQPSSIDAARADLSGMIARVREVASRLPSTPSGRKSFHPLFGHLDPDQWLAFIVMHTRHHLRQKKRIERGLGT